MPAEWVAPFDGYCSQNDLNSVLQNWGWALASFTAPEPVSEVALGVFVSREYPGPVESSVENQIAPAVQPAEEETIELIPVDVPGVDALGVDVNVDVNLEPGTATEETSGFMIYPEGTMLEDIGAGTSTDTTVIDKLEPELVLEI